MDIPDPVYRELKSEAAREGTSVKQIILRKVMYDPRQTEAAAPKKLKYPLVASKQPGVQARRGGCLRIHPFSLT